MTSIRELSGDPQRPALDTGQLKPFTLRPRSGQPNVSTSSEVLVAALRGREKA